MMRTILAVATALALSACGASSSGDETASDPNPAPSDQPSATSATAIPAAAGIVGTRDLVTVMDTGEPVLCLGAVAESYPPQCSGPPIAGWSWKDQQGAFEKSGDIRWGLFSLGGTWDGSTFTVRSSVPAALYDAMPADPSPYEIGEGGPEQADVLAELERDPLPGTLTVTPWKDVIQVDVVYDDGSIQADATDRFGETVTVTSALVDAGR